jgi:signal transduction histidine kinase
VSRLRRLLRRELSSRLGIRVIDVLATAVVIGAVELNVVTGGGPGATPLSGLAYLQGAVLALPVLLRRRWPFAVLIACTVLLFGYYSAGFRRNISPAPLLSLPLYDAALAGYLTWAIVIPAVYMAIGLIVVEASTHAGLATLTSDFLPSAVVMALAVMLGEVARGRRALAAETAERLRLAREEHEADAGRRLAEERLRIARELHDTVAHGMATISVQAGSALHVLGGPQPDTGAVRAALTAIRDTSKTALAEMRHTLGQLRGGGRDVDAEAVRTAGLDRLGTLAEAVRAAGAPVAVHVEGSPAPLPPEVDHAAYRILQESLTNVLRHAGPQASATVRVCYAPGVLTLRVTDNGTGAADGNGSAPGRPAGAGHGIAGMAERAAAVGGDVRAGPRPEGGFAVLAHLPIAVLPGPAPGRTVPPGLAQGHEASPGAAKGSAVPPGLAQGRRADTGARP